MKEYLLSATEVLEKLSSQQAGGLTEDEAKLRLEKNGPNKLIEA